MATLPVYTGYWVDHSKGSHLGATLTLKAASGTYLVASAAIVIQLMGTAIWSLIAFFIYQYRTKNKEFRSGFTAQSQIIIRNEGDPLAASFELAKLGYSWRGHATRARTRGFALAVGPFVLYMGLIAAGVLVGNIAVNAYDSSHVLIKSFDCGTVDPAVAADRALNFANLYVNSSIVANSYAKTCYSGFDSAAITCNFYPKKALPYTVNRNVSCPIPDASICAGPVIEFATPPLDSHEDFGVNAPPEDRITLQKWSTCAPLSTEYLDRNTVLVDFGIRQNNVTYYTRQYSIGNYGSANLFGGANFSFAYPEIQYGLGVLPYETYSTLSVAPHDTDLNSWQVPPEFVDIPGDISLIYMATNSIQYTEPVDDPFFLAQNATTIPGSNSTYYMASRYVNAMLCMEQYQICNPVNQKCTAKGGVFGGVGTVQEYLDDVNALEFNPRQNATFQRTASLGLVTNMYSAVNNVPGAIQALERLSIAPISLPLPANQWEIESEGWFQTTLATVQDFVVEYAYKFSSYKTAVDIVPPDTEELAAECKSQRISTPPYYQNYSFVGIMVVFTLGIFFVMLALTIRIIIFSLPSTREGNSMFHKRYAYERDGTMSLYKIANTLSDREEDRWKPVRNDTGNTLKSLNESDSENMGAKPTNGNVQVAETDGESKADQKQKRPLLSRFGLGK